MAAPLDNEIQDVQLDADDLGPVWKRFSKLIAAY